TSVSPNGAPAARFPNLPHPVVRLPKHPAPARGRVRVARSGAGTGRALPHAPCAPSTSRPPNPASIRLESSVPYVCSYEPALMSIGTNQPWKKFPNLLSLNWTWKNGKGHQLKTTLTDNRFLIVTNL